MQVNYRDLKILEKSERQSFIESLDKSMDSGIFMMDKAVKDFEDQFSSYCSRSYGIGVSSGTSGLILAMKGLNIGPGDEVITTSMSWLATANAIILRGAKPVFVDVDESLNMDVEAVEKAINSNTKAIMAVHFCGRICDIDKLHDIAYRKGILLIEDASQAAGAIFKGEKAGFWGHAAAFSLNPMKPLGALGEAGIVLSDDEQFTNKVRSLRYLGTKDIEICEDPDLNHKIDEIQALWLLERLKRLDDTLSKRRSLAKRFSESFPEGIRIIGIEEPNRTTFFEFTIEVDNRDELKQYLDRLQIETRIKHPILMCDQPGYSKEFGKKIPNARRLVKRILSLPLYPSLTNQQCEHISSSLSKFFKKGYKRREKK